MKRGFLFGGGVASSLDKEESIKNKKSNEHMINGNKKGYNLNQK